MAGYLIHGGSKLSGRLSISGAKNAVLPILAASVINGNKSVIKGYPKLRDVDMMLEMLSKLGCKIEKDDDTIIVDSKDIFTCNVDENLVREMRSSIFLMGPMLSRFGKIKISYPGGCAIGPRPIDIHLKGLREMGVVINESHGFLICEADSLHGADINLDYPSVGATENIMLAAVLAKGKTIIRSAAKEPEIVDLQDYLNAMGARVSGAGTSVIEIEGVDKLGEVAHRVIPDRIVAGSILMAGAITQSEITIENVIPDHIVAILAKLKETGCDIVRDRADELKIIPPKVLRAIDTVRTLPYPGFATDLQPQFVTLLSVCRGTSIVFETVFEHRFNYTEELARMGADIKINGKVAVVKGVRSLAGAKVCAKDLRGGAALVLAGISAEGETLVDNVRHIDRGYDNLHLMLNSIGANIIRIE